MVEFRPVCLDDDRDLVLDMLVIRAFEAAPEADRRRGLNEFRKQWLASPQADAWLNALQASMEDRRTVAEVILVNAVPAGVMWATFEGPPYEAVFAELRLIAFRLNFQRQGLGRLSVHRLEELATERGAVSLRSTGSAPSEGIRRFHASVGFEPVQTVFERKLEPRSH